MIRKMQLPLQTANLVVGFMVWVLISSLLPFITEDITIPAERLAIVTAIPVVLGSILRIPLGYYANIFGARIIFLVSFILLLFPVYYISETSSVAGLIIGGTFLGIGERSSPSGSPPCRNIFRRRSMGSSMGSTGWGTSGRRFPHLPLLF